jgi:hypothetical protein
VGEDNGDGRSVTGGRAGARRGGLEFSLSVGGCRCYL